jgi:hypothetical protein
VERVPGRKWFDLLIESDEFSRALLDGGQDVASSIPVTFTVVATDKSPADARLRYRAILFLGHVRSFARELVWFTLREHHYPISINQIYDGFILWNF